MTSKRAVHIGVANPHVRDFVVEHAVESLADAEWEALTEKVQDYAERSVAAVERICRQFGIHSAPSLIGHDATYDRVKRAFDDMVAGAGQDGLLVLSFAGHGRLFEDTGNDEPDGCDTAWLLADRPLSDDDLRGWLRGVPPGCTVIVLGDCCRAGGMALAASLVCTPNPNAGQPAPPAASCVHICAVDKDSLWVPGTLEPTFGDEVERRLADGSCATYRMLQERLVKDQPVNHRSVIKCSPPAMWDAAPFVKR